MWKPLDKSGKVAPISRIYFDLAPWARDFAQSDERWRAGPCFEIESLHVSFCPPSGLSCVTSSSSVRGFHLSIHQSPSQLRSSRWQGRISSGPLRGPGEPRIIPRREAAAAFSSEFLRCFNDPSQPSIYFSGVSLQRGCALLQKLNLAFCLAAEVRHANLVAFKASAFCPSFSQNAFRALFLKKHHRVPIYPPLPEDQSRTSGAGFP